MAGCQFEHGNTPGAPADAVDSPPTMTDEDGDGVLDDVDNCPAMANADQLDHDTDGRGDVCDHCPHLNTANADPDADGDGVGDLCDPRPNTAGDRRVLFEGFTAGTSANNWTRTGPAPWSVANGRVQQVDPNTGDALLAPPMQMQKVYAATSFKVVGFPTVAAGSSIGMCVGALPGNSQYYCCTISAGGATLRESSSIEPAQTTTWQGTFAVGDTVQIIQNLATGNQCRAVQGSIDLSLTGNASGTMGSVELYTGAAAASFDYLFLVEIGS